MKSPLLFCAAILTTLFGLGAAAGFSNKAPCKVDANCDATKFLHCTKLPFETKQQCLCKPGMTWQGNPEECRLRDGSNCETDAEFEPSKPMCLDGFYCGISSDAVSGASVAICRRNPLGIKNFRKSRPPGMSTAKPNDPDAAQASKWKEEHPESVPESIGVTVTTNGTKPPEVKEEPKMPMGRGIALRKGKAAEETEDATEPAEEEATEAASEETATEAVPESPNEASEAPEKPPENIPGPQTSPTTEKGGANPIPPGPATPPPGPSPPRKSNPDYPENGCEDTVCNEKDRHDKEALKKMYEKLYGSFAANSKTLSSAIAIFALIAGTMIL